MPLSFEEEQISEHIVLITSMYKGAGSGFKLFCCFHLSSKIKGTSYYSFDYYSPGVNDWIIIYLGTVNYLG